MKVTGKTHRDQNRAFTLVEIMVAVAVLAMLLAISAQVIGQAQRTWTRSAAKLSQFREVRLAFDLMTKTLAQATLGSYWVDDRTSPEEVSTRFVRKSDLQFLTGPASEIVKGDGEVVGHAVFFQAPLGIAQYQANAGLANLLCGRGYFVQYSSDENFRPEFLTDMPARNRYRLMEYSPYAEKNSIFERGPNEWFADAGTRGSQAQRADEGASRGTTRPIADNIVFLAISPRFRTGTGKNEVSTEIAPEYSFDSVEIENQDLAGTLGGATEEQGTQHLLPPALRVVLIAVDETSAQRMEAESQPNFMRSGPVKFSRADQLDQDIAKLEKFLNDEKLNYRVFSTTIALHDS